jgi:hypothetical protein
MVSPVFHLIDISNCASTHLRCAHAQVSLSAKFVLPQEHRDDVSEVEGHIRYIELLA